ncbi:hypothetical protein BD289DRAFT_59400 [Coniella lustricola]|uniref:Uncharacterized protein n=1 Tax=Coniella lustricola TaxID=2025994 RepID=A0A2T3A0X2_9PEZI|nr:hypothetical protein BD289DRAFT_59400 [Coniella lustricola]
MASSFLRSLVPHLIPLSSGSWLLFIYNGCFMILWLSLLKFRALYSCTRTIWILFFFLFFPLVAASCGHTTTNLYIMYICRSDAVSFLHIFDG